MSKLLTVITLAILTNVEPLSSASWIESANMKGCDFPIENLPYGIFKEQGSENHGKIGVAIGDQVLDLKACKDAGLLEELTPETRTALEASTLNPLMALERKDWQALRQRIHSLLDENNPELRDNPNLQSTLLVFQNRTEMLMPVKIGDYTDFYSSLSHASHVGALFRPDNPLMPNYKHLPVGYHGRASSVVLSGTDVKRPMGQLLASADDKPTLNLCQRLDYEMEMGVLVGQGNALGERIPMSETRQHLFGMVIINDWSARDIQKWEYRPLGPFNGKNFITSMSPWVVSFEALEPYRVPGPPRGEGDPETLTYLQPTEDMALDITVEVWLRTPDMEEPVLLSRGNTKDLYWTVAQMLVHHSSAGCNMCPGDLYATGTISQEADDSLGCLLEMTRGGKQPITLPNGSQRCFLEDGDEVVMKAYAERPGLPRIGFGECRGTIVSQ